MCLLKVNKNQILYILYMYVSDAVWKTEENMCFHDHRDHLLALLERLDIIARPRSFIEDESQTKVSNHVVL